YHCRSQGGSPQRHADPAYAPANDARLEIVGQRSESRIRSPGQARAETDPRLVTLFSALAKDANAAVRHICPVDGDLVRGVLGRVVGGPGLLVSAAGVAVAAPRRHRR